MYKNERIIITPQSSAIQVEGGKDVINLCANNYLGLADNPELIQAAKDRMAIAWILRHSAKIQPVVGSVNLERMRDIAKAADVTITRKEWYDLYCATGKSLP